MCAFLFLYCIVLVRENFGTLAGGWFFIIMTGVIGNLYFLLCQPCKVSSNQKKTAINENQTAKKTTSTLFDVKPIKQYPVLDEIQNIISNLSELETDIDLDKNMFVKFHSLKEQFDVDYQKTIKILTKLDKFKSINEKHLRVFNHYLDLFKEEKDCIYKQIEQNYDNEIDAIYKNLDNIND